jgi:outer membrane receptor protein involved in Fe transport
MDTRSSKSESWIVRAALAAMLSYALVIPSMAAEAAAEDDVDELDTVEITGTRIQVPGNFTSANPITSITGEEMRNLGIVNVSDALLQLVPQNISTYQPNMVGDDQAGFGGAGMETMDRSSFFIGNTIANLRGLDPTFGTRTLTLVDGRRMVSTSNQADVVDLNIIPSNLLQRMDVVTGGASATYGSGAMAGVVNLVLNNRLTGFNLDIDYGLNEAGDGGSPHIAASGGMPLFGGRAHALIGVEWQRTSAIRSCADARTWCAASRTLFNNATGSTTNQFGVLTPIDGFSGYPARFEMANVRYSQWGGDTPDEFGNGTVYHNSVNNLFGVSMSQDGMGYNEYAYGFRGGSGGNVINGDGPLTTSGTAMRPSNTRKTMFSNFEFNITERTTAYLQTNYAVTDSLNVNRFTTGTHCVRFNNLGAAGTNVNLGTEVFFSGTAAANAGALGSIDGTNTSSYPPAGKTRSAPFTTFTQGFADFLDLPGGTVTSYVSGNGWRADGVTFTASQSVTTYRGTTVPGTAPNNVITDARGVAFPFWLPVQLSPGGPPTFDFGGNGVGKWVRFRFTDANFNGVTFGTPFWNNDFWLLESVTLTNPYEGGAPPVLASLGKNSYAFLNTLDPEALTRLQQNTGTSATAGGGSGLQLLYGDNPCSGYTAMRKVWNPQVQQKTTQHSETMRVVAGIKGRFGRDWRWDASYTWGKTDSQSNQTDVATNIRLAFAMDAVIDDRGPTILDTRETVNGQPNPTFNQMIANVTNGQPICRVVRDGTPILDTAGRPLSDAEGLAAMGAACRPLNVFGQSYETTSSHFPGGYNPAQTQQEALDYAFVDSSRSGGKNSLQTLQFTLNGTLWQGWGAGPLTSAWGIEARKNTANQDATPGSTWERYDMSRTWSDAFGGSTTVTEGFTELNMPLVSGQPGVNLWSLNLGGRYSSYYNKGGAGTAVDENGKHLDSTQNVFNWKIQTVFEPFDWIRLRLSRSRDLRTAGYRDLFIDQPGIPDSSQIRNPWRERSATTNENQSERYTQVTVGNPNLKPESSDTLTMGIVLSPSGWAQGLRFSIDYYNIHVKDGIGVSNRGGNPVDECFADSNGVNPVFDPESGQMSNLAEYEDWRTGPNAFNESSEACQELQFAMNEDGTRNLNDLLRFNGSRPANLLPYQRRGMDLSLQYMFPLSRAFESLPGNLSLRVTAQRAMEASGVQMTSNPQGYYTVNGTPGGTRDAFLLTRERNPDSCGAKFDAADPENSRPSVVTIGNQQFAFGPGTDRPSGFYTNRYTCIDLLGQIRSSTFVPGVTAAPRWSGNFTVTYLVGDLTTTLSARYTGGAVLDRTWCDASQQAAGYCSSYQNASGQFLNGSVDNNKVKPYLNYSLNGSYNLKVADMKQFQVFGSINNLFNKSPPFTGGGISGASSQYHDTMGRAYRMGVRMKF